jgi:hypothetical protein
LIVDGIRVRITVTLTTLALLGVYSVAPKCKRAEC